MKHITRLLLILPLAAAAASSTPIASRAGKLESNHPATQPQALATGPTQESGWGMGARYGCRLGVSRGHYNLATFGFCLMALVDAVS